MTTPRTDTPHSIEHQYRIAFLGSCGVGKTAIMKQLVYKEFNTLYEPTLETDLDYITEYNGFTYICLFIDTCGSNEFPAMRKLCLSKSNAFLIVFSLNDRQSFENAKLTVTEIKQSKPDEILNIMIVGNKRDLQHKVYANEAKEFVYSSSYGNTRCKYCEVSAKNRDDVINMFHTLLDMFPGDTDTIQRNDKRKSCRRKSMSKTNRMTRTFDGNDSISIPIDVRSSPIDIQLPQRSPSLYSLNNFSSDDDLDNHCNYVQGEEHIRKGFFQILSKKTKSKCSPKSL